MRLIDADAIHSTLADWQLMLSETYGTNDEFVRCLEDVLCTVDNAPTIPAPRWHRVEEDLPPRGFGLIGARKRPPEISEDFWDMWVCEYDGEWGWQDMDGYALRGITHWMPIEPPKEVQNDNNKM